MAGRGRRARRPRQRPVPLERRRRRRFAEPGEHGEERWLKLELKLLADVGLVGFPNVGKSTLIVVISAAKPKIADYPFTTLEPELGVVRVDDETEFVIADLPGLIEGAAEGRGLGHRFLRHVERARVLCLMIDLAPMDGVSPQEQERVLLAELGQYQPELLDRPRLVVGTKGDAVSSEHVAELGWTGDVLSAVTGQGVAALVGRMAALVHDARTVEPEHDGVIVIRPEVRGARIEHVGDGEFRLVGRERRAGGRAQRRDDARGALLHRSAARQAGRPEDARSRRCRRRRRGVDRRVQLRVPRRCVSPGVSRRPERHTAIARAAAVTL